MRRRTRGIPVLVVLLCALVFGLSTSSADPTAPATGPFADDVSAGLQSFAGALTSLNGLNELGQSLPFTSVVPSDSSSLDFAHSFADSLQAKLAAHVGPYSSLADLSSYINTNVAGALGSGVNVTASSTVADGAAGTYTLTLNFGLSRDSTTALAVHTSAVDVNGGSLTTHFASSFNLTFKYDPSQAAGNKFYLDTGSNPALTTTVSAAAAAITPFDVNLGITRVHVGGNADIGGTISAQLQDPDGNGKITQTEWTTTAPQQAFDVHFSPSHANADLTLSSDIPASVGGALTSATIHEADSDLSNGLDTPTVNLGDLGGFKNMQPQDFLSGLASLAIAMQTLTTAGPAAVDLPFLHRDPAAPAGSASIEKLGDVLKLNDGLIQFFEHAGLSTTTSPLTLNFTAGNLASLANVQDILAALQAAGVDVPALGLAYDPTSKKLVFKIGQTATPTPIQAHVAMNDQLKAIGLTGVNSLGLQATVSPTYDWKVELGVDLNPAGASSLNDRVFIVPSGTEFKASAPISAQLQLAGQVGFLGLKLESVTGDPATPNTVQLLGPADASKPMLDVKLKDPGGDKLTLSQFFDAFGSATTTADPFQVLQGSSASDLINAAVPPFDLRASANFANDTVTASGTLHVGWSNILDPTTLSLSAEPDFGSNFLDFAYDPSNPQAMFTQLLQILGPLTQQVSQMVQNDPKLQEKLPLINKSFADLVTAFTTLQQTINDFASNPQGYLQAFESALEKAIGDAFGLPSLTAADADVRSKLVALTLTPATASDPATLGVRLSFGICTSADGTSSDTDCTVTKALHVPLALSLPDVGGLVSVGGTGGVDITSKAVVKIGFGIKLPSVSGGLPGGDPTVSGSPQLFLSTDPANTALNIDVNASTSPGTTLSASVGPLTMNLGKVDYVAESGSQCAPGDVIDDNHNGVINDGCPAVGDPEDATTGQCTGTTDDDSDGTVNDGCPVVQQSIEAKLGAKFHLSHDSGDLVIDPADLSNLTTWVGDLIPTSVDGFRPATQVDCQASPSDSPPAGPYDACASIPVYVGTGASSPPDGLITFVAPNVFDTSTWHGHVDDGITNAILGSPLDWATVIQGLHTVVHNLRSALDASAYGGASIPIIGHSLDGGAKIADTLDDKLVSPLNDAVTTLNGADFTTVQSTIKDTIWNGIGGGGDVKLVLPYAADAADGTTATEDDIKVTLECGTDLHACVDGTDGVATLTNVEVSLAVGGTLADAHFKFDSGFPGLRLTMDNPIDASVKFRYELTFGLSRTQGFYIRTDAPAGMHSDGKEVAVDASVHLPDTGTHGDIAFLRIDGTNNQTGGHKDLDLQLAMDIKGGNVDTDGAKKLTFSALTASDPSDPADVEVTLAGKVDVNLHLVLSANMPASVGSLPGEGALPKLSADLVIGWDFGAGISFNNGVSGHVSDLNVDFTNVQLDLGSFWHDFLGPIVRNIQSFTKPLQPVIDTVEAPIPGLSQMSELAGQGPITFLDFFEHATGADLTMIHRLIDLIDLINHLPSDGSMIDLGHFSLDSNKVEGAAPTGDNADTLIDQTSESHPTDVLAGHGNSQLDTAKSEGGLTFPAFQNPTQLFGLLVGKDVKLIEYDAGTLEASFGFDITIGPFPAGPVPVSIIIGGSAGVQGHFAIGYSTRGIREAVKNLTDDDDSNDGALQNASLLIDGVFLDDLNSDGIDVPEIRLTAEVHAGAEVDIVIASAGIEVGIEAEVDLNLHDGGRPTDPAKVDGLVYIDELASAFLVNPICIFDVDGKLSAFVKFFIDVGISPFDISFEITLVEVTLLDMKDITGPICDHPDPPHLAQEDDSSKTLVLKMGPNTPGRNLAEDRKDEKFVVRQLDNNAGPGHKFSVTAFGLTQDYPEDGHPLIEHIYANGGDGKDTIVMQPGVKATNTGTGPTDVSVQSFDVTVPVFLCGGSDVDSIQAGDGNDTVVGDGSDSASGINSCATTGDTAGGDSDTLGGGPGNDTIDGNNGGDAIVGEAGNDVIDAGSGDDSVQGGAGSDTLSGQDGADTLTGGPENDPTKTGSGVTDADVTDHIDGGNGPDNIDGGPGPDTLNGNAGNDSITGGTGNDTIDGGADQDLITAGKGDDNASGGSGDDVMFGQEGNDTLNGNDGNDNIVGSVGNDIVDGGAGSDWILGDDGTIANDRSSISVKPNDATDGNDTLSGGADGDLIWAESGNDTIHGNGGDDELHGQNGNDTMNGDDGADTMFGDAGADTMHGDAGNDTMRGGSEDDVMTGDANDDTMFGDAGVDTMHGNDGIDHMRGGTEHDVMYGDANDDVMNGDAGPDTMYGNDGNDSMHGDAGDDYMEGNADTDTMTGDAGQDDMLGGSSIAAANDAGDVMYGGDGVTPGLSFDHDVMIGDNGTITRPGTLRVDGAFNRTVVLYDLAAGSLPTAYGNDTMSGNDGNDMLYGGNGDDRAYGGNGDDGVEGNAGNDALFGDGGQDDLIGGSSQAAGTPDGNDCIEGDVRADGCTGDGAAELPGAGNAGGDVMIGDNGSIGRTPNAANTDWVRDNFGMGTDGVVRRTITLYDVGTTTFTPPAGVAGNDTLWGDDARDVQYGQGGNDTTHGGNGDDYAEGNAGTDTMFGDAGNDDLVGGSYDALRLDANDTIDGGPGYDVIAGDNAQLVRTLVGGQWVKNTYDDGISHVARVLDDIDSSSSSVVSGGDTIFGGTENDLIYGQGGSDTIQGNAGDDFIEGNAAGDTINGNENQDDIVGGTVQAAVGDGADVIHGDDASDVVAGDNATITRPLDAGHWIHDNRSNGAPDIVRRAVTLYDVATTSSTPAAGSSDGDNITGDNGADQIFGQGGNDTISGGADDDYAEGNAGNDTITGDAGRDDAIGGGSSNTGVISPTSVGNGLVDGADSIHGNDSGDAIAGDNARITRLPLAASGIAAGLWTTDPNTAADGAGDRDPWRTVQLFDLDSVSSHPSSATNAGDSLSGDDGRDIMAGQGGDDAMSGGDGVDYMAGNTGTDTMFGDGGEDDMIGGSSAGNGLLGDVLPASLRPAYSTPRNLSDGGDIMSGNLEDDVLVGDNASIVRPERGAPGTWWRLTNANFDLARRIVTMEKTPESAGAFGNDTMSGNDGHDDMYGQLGNDTMNGNEGEDAMVGDLGLITNNLIDGGADGMADPGPTQMIAPNAPFFDPGETIFAAASLYRQVELYSFDKLLPNVGAGDDTMFGGDGHDSMHGGPGADVMDGNAGDDYMFADDSSLVTFPIATYSPVGGDAMWGGPGHDTMYGGHGVDYIDVLPRPVYVDKKGTFPKDPQAWFDAVATDPVQADGHAGAYSGLDIMYGGWDQDWMQLDVSAPGPPPGDRALDWNGGFNAYYRCDPAYGDWGITRQHSPSMQTFLQQLAFGMGAVQTSTPGTSGYDEVAMVFPGDKDNANPVNPDNPAHFTCGVPHS